MDSNIGDLSFSVSVEQLTFSDGTTVSLQDDDIVVFVGPNNAGKSASLREIEALFHPSSPSGKVITSMEKKLRGNEAQLVEALEAYSHKTKSNNGVSYSGNGYSISERHVNAAVQGRFDLIQGFFCKRLRTETRITDSQAAPSFKVLTEPASRPIQMLYSDSDIEDRISSYFKEAFNQDLIVMKGGGSEIPLLVGERQPLLAGEDPTKKSYLERLMNSTSPLHDQGDGMRSFASVILEMLASRAPSMLLLDEPEAFLHPPQARLLGEFLAKERRPNVQLFIATHSPDILSGLLNIAPEQLRVIRLQREGNSNEVKELEKNQAKAIGADPLMKYSSVLSGIFHERAIICEADADCMFYQAMLAQPAVHTGPNPDVLFLHASGKHRMAMLAASLKALGVPVDVVADIDLLSEKATFEKLVAALGGDWAKVEAHWNSVKSAVDSRMPSLNADAVIGQIQEEFATAEGQAEFPKRNAAEIKSILKRASPWGIVKSAGESAIPSGQATKDMMALRNYLEAIGLWIVPVGELEGFCRSVGGHGPKWVQKVIEERELASDPELETARAFIRAIWSRQPMRNTSLA